MGGGGYVINDTEVSLQPFYIRNILVELSVTVWRPPPISVPAEAMCATIAIVMQLTGYKMTTVFIGAIISTCPINMIGHVL